MDTLGLIGPQRKPDDKIVQILNAKEAQNLL